MMGLIQVAHAYDVELYSAVKERAAKVRIGSNAASIGEKFVPNINMSKWDNEHWINFNFPIVVTNQIETFDGEKVSITVGDYAFNYYPLNTDDLEYEIIFGKKPPIMSVSLDIVNSDGLTFYYQPALTQERIDHGATQPENVVGSYAVYCNKANNKYCTGKFCHIYFPYLIDADGIKTRVEDFLIADGKMQITLPSEWMSTARYPIILDPTIGYSTVGADSEPLENNITHATADQSTDASGGNTGKYHIAVASISSGAGLKLGVYAASVGAPTGNPVDQVAGTATVSDDCQINAQGNLLAASTSYVPVVIAATNGSITCKMDTLTSGDSHYKTSAVYANEFTSPAGTYADDDWVFSFWVDYAVAAGGGTLLLLRKS